MTTTKTTGSAKAASKTKSEAAEKTQKEPSTARKESESKATALFSSRRVWPD